MNISEITECGICGAKYNFEEGYYRTSLNCLSCGACWWKNQWYSKEDWEKNVERSHLFKGYMTERQCPEHGNTLRFERKPDDNPDYDYGVCHVCGKTFRFDKED